MIRSGMGKRIIRFQSAKHEKTSTKESLLNKLRSMKNREFTMNIPVGEGAEDEH